MSPHRVLASTVIWCLEVQLTAICLLLPVLAQAAPKDAEASALARRAMKTDYACTVFKKAEQKVKKAVALCGSSEAVLARLHRGLATVYIADTKQVPKGKAQLELALSADLDAQLDSRREARSASRSFVTSAGEHGPGKMVWTGPAAAAATFRFISTQN